MFKLRLNAFTVNSQISGCWCKVSVLQQMEMGLPNPERDLSLDLLFEIDMSLEQIKEMGMENEFRAGSAIGASAPMRSPEDVENVAVFLSKIVEKWEPRAIGGNWLGQIIYSTENVNTMLRAMGKPVVSAA